MIQRSENEISIDGSVKSFQLRGFCNHIGRAVEENYRNIVLDFSSCSSTSAELMLPLLPIISKYKQDGVKFDLRLPKLEPLKRLFCNANWAFYIEPDKYEKNESRFTDKIHLPAVNFNIDEPKKCDDILNQILGIVLGLFQIERSSLSALEWALSEIMDNVINHSQSPVGGFVQATTYPKYKMVEFVVADAGVGIPETIRCEDHAQALTKAIEEGVTRDPEKNAGNGLYGSYRVALLSKGQFEIHSLLGFLNSNKNTLTNHIQKYNYGGTSIRCGVNFSNPELLHQALKFGGKEHDPPYDYIERNFENDEGEIIVKMSEMINQYGMTRIGAAEIKNVTDNLLKENGKIVLDFEKLSVISSSFADEILGRLFSQLGLSTFARKIELQNMDSTVARLIDRAVDQRKGRIRPESVDNRSEGRGFLQEGVSAEGVIESLDSRFGFVSVEGEKMFFHVNQLMFGKEWEQLKAGMHVSFRVGKRKEKLCALWVKVRPSPKDEWLHNRMIFNALRKKDRKQNIFLLTAWALVEADSKGGTANGLEVFDRLMKITALEKIEKLDEIVCHARKLFNGVSQNTNEIEDYLSQHSSEPLSEVGIGVRSILKIAAFDLKSKDDEIRIYSRGDSIIIGTIAIATSLLDRQQVRYLIDVLESIFPEFNRTVHEEQTGGIVYRVDDEIKFALVKDGRGKWTMSKGKLEQGEINEHGFKRIMSEEMGLQVIRTDKEIGKMKIRTQYEYQRIQTITYYVGESEDEKIEVADKPGLKGACWLTLNQIETLNQYSPSIFYSDSIEIILRAARDIVAQRKGGGAE